MITIKNPNAVFRGLDIWVKRQEDMVVAEYRDLVWKIFLRLLRETPQYTGHAAASWNIGVGAPDMSETDYVSDVVETSSPPDRGSKSRGLVGHGWEPPDNVREKGDRRAIESAKRRGAKKIPLIQRGSKVYFTNTAMGDMSTKVDKAHGGGAAGTYYLEALQDRGYWQAKLRAVNKPYETANETVVAVNEGLLSRAGQSFRVGGETWETYL